MKKNQILLIIFLLLVITNAVLILFNSDGKRENESLDLLAVTTPEDISQISLNGQQDSSVFIKTSDEGWRLNNKYAVDQGLGTVLLRVLNSVQVKRPVSKLDQEKIFKECINKGVEVKVFDQSKSLLQHYYAHGNPTHTLSYFADVKTKTVYVMEIPGYTNYISGLFSLAPSQWRDRMLFSTSWSSLQRLAINYTDKEEASFTIVPGHQFPRLEADVAYDTTTLMNYLEQLDYYQSNEIISKGIFPRYDSLAQTAPIATILVKDLDAKTSNQVRVFPQLSNEKIQLVVDENENMAVIAIDRLEKILVTKGYFLQSKKL